MKYHSFFPVVICLGLLISPSCIWAQVTVEMPAQPVISSAVANVQESVVQIETIGGKARVAGAVVTNQPRSGLIVGTDGWIVTATYNLAHEPTAVFVKIPDGQRLPATIVSRNHARKITLLKVETAQPLPVAERVNRRELKVGQTAIAVGRSLSWETPSVSVGIISALRRIWDRAVQTDAAVSPHNFGGPLIDIQGRVIGILVPLSPQSEDVSDGVDWYDSGIGFAVPLETNDLERMVTGVDLSPGRMGVTFKEDRGYASRSVVAACPGNSPAARAGLQSGDEITRINGQDTARVSQIRHALGPLYAGDDVVIEGLRNGEAFAINVELVDKVKPWKHVMLGLIARNGDLGLEVQNVFPDGPAKLAGIEVGDRIIAFNDQPISNQQEIESELMKSTLGQAVTLTVNRGGQTMPLVLQLAWLAADPVASLSTEVAAESKIEVLRLPESPNRCYGYFPESTEPSALLLWIGEPGKVQIDELLKQWKPWCHQTNTAILFPESLDDQRWSRDEIDFLNKIAEQAQQQHSVDPFKVAVGGQGPGGVLASLVGMSQKKTWRGLVLVNTGPSTRIAQHQSEPGQRQLFLILDAAAEDNTQAEMTRWLEHFKEQGFPAVKQSLDLQDLPQRVTEWLQSLGRL